MIVAETSKAPTTYRATEILKSKGIRILPDVLLTGGGAYVSYFEWLKNLDHIRPGRMTRRWEFYSKIKLLKVIE
jgi:glutamate dehydrogenase (NAD(P)+)